MDDADAVALLCSPHNGMRIAICLGIAVSLRQRRRLHRRRLRRRKISKHDKFVISF